MHTRLYLGKLQLLFLLFLYTFVLRVFIECYASHGPLCFPAGGWSW